MKNLKYLSLALLTGLVFVACEKEDDGPVDPVATCTDGIQNGDETGVDCGGTSCAPCTTVAEIPDTYVFERNGESTVRFSGQTTRLMMAKEILGLLRDNSATEAQIMAAYNHQAGVADFSDADLNASDKQVRNKTAGSYFFQNFMPSIASSEVVADFEGFVTGQVNEVFPAWNTVAAAGTAGQIADGSSTRYVNAKGLEYDQAFIKGLTGAFVADQIVGNYTFPGNLERFEAANDEGIIVDGKTYTDLEHDWDEAYGYFFGLAADSSDPLAALLDGGDPGSFSSGDDEFLYKYIDNVEANFEGTAEAIFDAFKAGRTAIINKDYAERDVQADILREEVAFVVAVRAVHYLKAGGNMAASPGTRLHDLSEAYGFIYSLQFLLKPGTNDQFYFTRQEVEGFLDTIYNNPTNGFWGVTTADLNSVAEAIAAKFSFSVAEVE